MEQLRLIDDVERIERPWKRTTGTSREAVRTFEQSGDAETLRRLCTRAIRAIWNRTQVSPRSEDIARYLFEKKVIPDLHPDHVKPRLSELYRGKWVWTKDAGGARVKVRIGGGAIEPAGKRASDRSRHMVTAWRVVERGTGRAISG